MKLGPLIGLAGAVSLIAIASARADTIYLTEPAPVANPPGYAYTTVVEPAPAYAYVAPEPVIAAPGYAIVGEPYVVVARPRSYVVERSVDWNGPRQLYRAPGRVIVSTRTARPVACAIGIDGYERCY